MASGYDPFDEYNIEFRNSIKEIETNLHANQNNANAIDIQNLLSQCQDLLLRMKIEARGAPGSSLKRELNDIYQACEMQLKTYKMLHQKKELFQSSSSSSNDSTTLFTSRQNSKDRLLSTKEKAERQNAHLASALRSIRETEEIAGEVSQELGRNRETLKRAHGNVNKMSGMMEQANGHLKSMMRKWF